ncbi:MAG: chromate transporter [Oscillospiraceae bacterium]
MIVFLLFFEYFKIGLFSIGGGLATIPFLYQLSDKYGWFDHAMIANMIAIAESTPGPIGVNIATYAGFQTAGILGSLIATMALVMPSVIMIMIIARMMRSFSKNKLVKGVFYALRPASTALVACACFQVIRIALFTVDNNVSMKAMLLFIVLYFMIRKFRFHPLVYLIIGAGCGILFQF